MLLQRVSTTWGLSICPCCWMKMPEPRLQCEIWVHTFKDGVLASIAHDLRLGCTGTEVTFDGQRVACRVDPHPSMWMAS